MELVAHELPVRRVARQMQLVGEHHQDALDRYVIRHLRANRLLPVASHTSRLISATHPLIRRTRFVSPASRARSRSGRARARSFEAQGSAAWPALSAPRRGGTRAGRPVGLHVGVDVVDALDRVAARGRAGRVGIVGGVRAEHRVDVRADRRGRRRHWFAASTAAAAVSDAAAARVPAGSSLASSASTIAPVLSNSVNDVVGVRQARVGGPEVVRGVVVAGEHRGRLIVDRRRSRSAAPPGLQARCRCCRGR